MRAAGHTLEVVDAGIMDYRAAWDMQLTLHQQVVDGTRPAGVLMLVEHPAVITIGRRPNAAAHLLAAAEMLAQRGVQVVETDRGGDITFHGPGQLVAYPIIPLNNYNLNLHAYMRAMEDAVIGTLATYGVTGERLCGATGVWVQQRGADEVPPTLAKVCAMGIKLRRWITLHGLALNVTTDLTYFDLINPCGLGRPVTSLQTILGAACPTMVAVKMHLTQQFHRVLSSSLGVQSRRAADCSVATKQANAYTPNATPNK